MIYGMVRLRYSAVMLLSKISVFTKDERRRKKRSVSLPQAAGQGQGMLLNYLQCVEALHTHDVAENVIK